MINSRILCRLQHFVSIWACPYASQIRSNSKHMKYNLLRPRPKSGMVLGLPNAVQTRTTHTRIGRLCPTSVGRSIKCGGSRAKFGTRQGNVDRRYTKFDQARLTSGPILPKPNACRATCRRKPNFEIPNRSGCWPWASTVGLQSTSGARCGRCDWKSKTLGGGAHWTRTSCHVCAVSNGSEGDAAGAPRSASPRSPRL